MQTDQPVRTPELGAPTRVGGCDESVTAHVDDAEGSRASAPASRLLGPRPVPANDGIEQVAVDFPEVAHPVSHLQAVFSLPPIVDPQSSTAAGRQELLNLVRAGDLADERLVGEALRSRR